MEEKSERLDLRAEKRVGVVDSGRKCRRARLIYTGLPKGHEVQMIALQGKAQEETRGLPLSLSMWVSLTQMQAT